MSNYDPPAIHRINTLRARLDTLAKKLEATEKDNHYLRARLREAQWSAEEAWEAKMHLERKLHDLENKA